MNQPLLTSVFTRLRTALKARAAFILGNDSNADDVLQEAFVRLWSSATALKDTSHAEGAAYRTVQNISIDLRRRAVAHPLTDTSALTSMPATDIEPRADDTLQQVEAIIETALSERDREILYKREMYSYEFDDLAQEYGLTPENIRTILSRARKTIRDRYRSG